MNSLSCYPPLVLPRRQPLKHDEECHGRSPDRSRCRSGLLRERAGDGFWQLSPRIGRAFDGEPALAVNAEAVVVTTSQASAQSISVFSDWSQRRKAHCMAYRQHPRDFLR